MLNGNWSHVNLRRLVGPEKPPEFYHSPKPYKPKVPILQTPIRRPRDWVARARSSPGKR